MASGKQGVAHAPAPNTSVLAVPTRRTAEEALHRLLADLRAGELAAALVREPGRDRFGVLEADVLVGPRDREALEHRLVDLGFRRRPGWGRHPHRFWLRPEFDDERGELDWLKVDLVTDLCFGRWHEITTGTGEACLRARTDGRLAPADELAALLLHALLDKGTIRADHRARLRALAPLAAAPGALADLCTGPGTGASTWSDLVELVRCGDWEVVSTMGDDVRRRAVAGRRVRTARSRARNRWGQRLAKPLTAIAGRGPLVALIGPDGTGKTTLAEGLAREAGIPAVVLYGGTYRSGSARSTVPGADTARVLGRLLRTRVDVARHRARGRLVVLDRHPVQVRPAPGQHLAPRTRLRRALLAATLPRADLYLTLDAPAPLLHDRRPEHDVAHLERDRLRHLELVRSTSAATVVDVATAPDRVRSDSIRLVWERAVATGLRHGPQA